MVVDKEYIDVMQRISETNARTSEILSRQTTVLEELVRGAKELNDRMHDIRTDTSITRDGISNFMETYWKVVIALTSALTLLASVIAYKGGG